MTGFKVAEVANNKNDEFYTPAYAITPLLRHIPLPSADHPIKIWCPFDTEESLFVKIFRVWGYQVIYTRIKNGQDFFTVEPPECDYIISNPPYSCKGEVLGRLFDLGKPFAMLVGVVGLFESQKRFDMFRTHTFEIMYFNRRIAYFKDYNDETPSLHPPFSSVYVCSKVLPQANVFEEITKTR